MLKEEEVVEDIKPHQKERQIEFGFISNKQRQTKLLIHIQQTNRRNAKLDCV